MAILSRKVTCCSESTALSLSIITLGVLPIDFSCKQETRAEVTITLVSNNASYINIINALPHPDLQCHLGKKIRHRSVSINKFDNNYQCNHSLATYRNWNGHVPFLEAVAEVTGSHEERAEEVVVMLVGCVITRLNFGHFLKIGNNREMSCNIGGQNNIINEIQDFTILL